MNDFYRDLGRCIAELRRPASLTQERLAERASITTSYLARIETGARKPTLDVVRRLADELDVPAWRLLADDRKPVTNDSHHGASDRLVAAADKLPAEDVRLLIEVALRFGRHARPKNAEAESPTAEGCDENPQAK